MAIFKSKKENLRELGFGSRNYKQRVRYLTPDGTINVQRTGLGRLNNLDIYHYLTTMSAGKLSFYIIVGYISINMLFGAIYYAIGAEQFEGVDVSSESQKFISLFFFSAQTITTLGYGHLHPTSNSASVAAAVESLLGLLSFAIATGIIFGRFSRPKSHVMYSNAILIAPYDEIKGLMFRVTNKKQYELIEADAVVNLTITNPETNKRDFHNLELEINHISFLPLSWTIVHPIDEKSPLFGLSKKDLE
jgi:inward rectifier potassium channel